MRCRYCNRKVGESRERGTLDYVVIHARDPKVGYYACLDCAKEIKASLKTVEPMIRPCIHNPDIECYEPTSTRISCLMLTQGWTVSKILCPHSSLYTGGRTQ